MQEPLFYDFKIETGNHYIYDGVTNNIFHIEEIDLPIIKNFKCMSIDELKSLLNDQYPEELVEKSHEKIKLLVEKNGSFFIKWSQKNMSKIPNSSEYFRQLVNTNQLVLELTQKCNLRCKYCAYGGSYKFQRNHSNISMPWEIAKRSIKYFFKLISSEERVIFPSSTSIAFYGGEPFIEYGIMKRCIEFIQKMYNMINVNFSITTNATLLNENIIKYLIKNDVNLLISLDGPAKEHNKHRIFKNGRPTFEIVWKKLKLIKKINFDYLQKNVTFSSVYTPYTNIHNVISFSKKIHSMGLNELSLKAVNPLNSDFLKRIPKLILNIHIRE